MSKRLANATANVNLSPQDAAVEAQLQGQFAQAIAYYQALDSDSLDVTNRFNWASCHIELQQWSAAEALLQPLVTAQVEHQDALYNLAFVYGRQDRSAEAFTLLLSGIQRYPDYEPYYQLWVTLLKPALSETVLSELAFNPLAELYALCSHDYHFSFCTSLLAQLKNQLSDEQVIQLYDALLSRYTENCDLICEYFNWGKNALPVQKKVDLLNHGLDLDPENSSLYYNLSQIFIATKEYDKAEYCAQKALSFDKDNVDFLINLGIIFHHKQETEKAYHVYKHVLQLDPENAVAMANISGELMDLGFAEQAIQFAEAAIVRDPNNVVSYINCSGAYQKIGKLDVALEILKYGLEKGPNNRLLIFNISMIYIQLGEVEKGFYYYRYREFFYEYMIGNTPTPFPLWMGESLVDKKVMVVNEQGLGDQILLYYFLPYLIADCTHIYIGIDKRLENLLKRSFPEENITFISQSINNNDLAAYKCDYLMPLASICEAYVAKIRHAIQAYSNTVNMLQRHIGYLRPCADKASYWKSCISKLNFNINIGVCWRSGVQNTKRSTHYMSAKQLAYCFNGLNINVINLQYSFQDSEIDILKESLPEQFVNFNDIDLKNDQDDLAAIVSQCDLVIGAGTALTMLAAACGVPVWVYSELHGTGSPYHFGCGGSPLLLSERLILKRQDEEWEDVARDINTSLKSLIYLVEGQNV